MFLIIYILFPCYTLHSSTVWKVFNASSVCTLTSALVNIYCINASALRWYCIWRNSYKQILRCMKQKLPRLSRSIIFLNPYSLWNVNLIPIWIEDRNDLGPTSKLSHGLPQTFSFDFFIYTSCFSFPFLTLLVKSQRLSGTKFSPPALISSIFG